MRFLVDLAWRDLRASGRSLWVFCACLTLGVALVAATGGLYRLVHQGLLADTRILLGGDVEVDADSALPEAVLEWIRERGDVSLVTELDTMLGTATGDFLRVEIQAMDAMYPLYGSLSLQPDLPLAEITAFDDGQWGAAIDPVLADSLGISVGDEVLDLEDPRVSRFDLSGRLSWPVWPTFAKRCCLSCARCGSRGGRSTGAAMPVSSRTTEPAPCPPF